MYILKQSLHARHNASELFGVLRKHFPALLEFSSQPGILISCGRVGGISHATTRHACACPLLGGLTIVAKPALCGRIHIQCCTTVAPATVFERIEPGRERSNVFTVCRSCNL